MDRLELNWDRRQKQDRLAKQQVETFKTPKGGSLANPFEK
jgi:hypothetical protein